jgi:hypothetical protein
VITGQIYSGRVAVAYVQGSPPKAAAPCDHAGFLTPGLGRRLGSKGAALMGTLSKIPRCKGIVVLLLGACLLTACDQANSPRAKNDARQTSGNGDEAVDLNNPLLTGDKPPTSAKVAAAEDLSRNGDRKFSVKSRLAEACAEDTIVMGYGKDGDVRRTGSDINGYCEGYLLAAYQSMISADAICRDEPQPPNAYFLRSVFQEHAKEDRALSRGDAQAVADAFLDAFSCKRSKS